MIRIFYYFFMNNLQQHQVKPRFGGLDRTFPLLPLLNKILEANANQSDEKVQNFLCKIK